MYIFSAVHCVYLDCFFYTVDYFFAVPIIAANILVVVNFFMLDIDFQLKGSTVTVVVLELIRFNPSTFIEQVNEKISQAPHFFLDSPLLISLEKLAVDVEFIDFNLLLSHCRKMNFQVIGFKAASEQFVNAIKATNLALLPSSTTRAKSQPLEVGNVQEIEKNSSSDSNEPSVAAEVITKTLVKERLIQRESKVITRPIRSGQQVYAEGADLIVLSQVSEGAEVLADGNIHIYGALRGRALAGVRGDESARIICQHMDAELVSIAGNFILSDAFDASIRMQPVHVYLQDGSIKIDSL